MQFINPTLNFVSYENESLFNSLFRKGTFLKLILKKRKLLDWDQENFGKIGNEKKLKSEQNENQQNECYGSVEQIINISPFHIQ